MQTLWSQKNANQPKDGRESLVKQIAIQQQGVTKQREKNASVEHSPLWFDKCRLQEKGCSCCGEPISAMVSAKLRAILTRANT